MPVSYIICAAGDGTRTRQISEQIPKPFLKVDGRSFLDWSIESLPVKRDDQVLILHSRAMKSDAVKENIATCASADIRLILVERLTRGQLETASLAYPQIPAGNSVSIFNSDTYFKCHELISEIESGRWDGLIPCSIEAGDAWSFCEVEEASKPPASIVRVTEKKRISKWCSVGFYWFRELEFLKGMTAREIEENRAGEIYVAPMYNRFIEHGLNIGMLPTQSFRPMGSLEQLQDYWGKSLPDMVSGNA